MARLKLLKKERGSGIGNYVYTYKCTCSNNKEHTISVPSANDNQAKQLAQIECDKKC